VRLVSSMASKACARDSVWCELPCATGAWTGDGVQRAAAHCLDPCGACSMQVLLDALPAAACWALGWRPGRSTVPMHRPATTQHTANVSASPSMHISTFLAAPACCPPDPQLVIWCALIP
jgi:hypothetical protein